MKKRAVICLVTSLLVAAACDSNDLKEMETQGIRGITCESPYYWQSENCEVLHETADPAVINGISFNGASQQDYVSVPPTTDFTIDEQGITYEAWVNLDERQYSNARAGATIISTGGHPDQGATDFGGVLLAYNGSSFYLGSERIIVNTNASGKYFRDGCHHVSASIKKNGTIYEAAIFVDGEEMVRKSRDTAGMVLADVNVDADIVIGGWARSVGQLIAGTTFNGFMRDIRIWRGMRTSAQIKADMGSDLTGTESGLLANWKLNDGGEEGDEVTDSVGQNHGVLMGGEYTKGCAISAAEPPYMVHVQAQLGDWPDFVNYTGATTGIRFKSTDLFDACTVHDFSNGKLNYSLSADRSFDCPKTLKMHVINTYGGAPIEEWNIDAPDLKFYRSSTYKGTFYCSYKSTDYHIELTDINDSNCQ